MKKRLHEVNVVAQPNVSPTTVRRMISRGELRCTMSSCCGPAMTTFLNISSSVRCVDASGGCIWPP